ncbi:MAG: signal peptide peptidase SppA [Deltaproteobacteria bacterium]
MSKKLVVGVIVLFLLVMGTLSIRSAGKTTSAVSGDGSGKVGVIQINGALTESGSDSMLSATGSDAGKIMEEIRKAAERDDIKALVLRINSPGGTSVAAQEVGVELDRFRKTGKPVVTSMGDVCASGGYWVACSTDRIVANPSTLTGSIGVIMEFSNLEGLYGKIGIREEVIKSGTYKDIGSSTRQLTAEERVMLQDLVNDSYSQFLDQVARGRKGKMTRAEIVKIADGRIISGRQGKKLGLVDDLGNYYEAVAMARGMAHLEKDSEVEVLNKPGIWESLVADVQANRLLPQQGWWQLRY